MSEFEVQAAAKALHSPQTTSPYSWFWTDSTKSLLCGAVGGTLEVCTDHPIDLIKVRLQTASQKSKTSLPTLLSNIIRTEGMFGLYRGASIRIATLMPGTAISFWGLDIGKQLVRTYTPSCGDVLTVPQIGWAGAFSALPVTLFATPSERIKCLLQIQKQSMTSQPPLYSGPLDCARYLYRNGGFASLYKGLTITLLRNVPGYSAWFGCYEFCKQGMMQRQNVTEASLATIVLSGGIAGSVSWLIMIPFDGVKSRIQTNTVRSVSIREAFTDLVAKEGYAGLFRGWRPAVLVAFPANAMCFLGMELSWKLLSDKKLVH